MPAWPALLQLRVDPRLGAMFPVAALGFAVAAAAGMALLVRRPAAQMQYLLLVGMIAGGSGRRLVRLAALCNVALLGGTALERASHLHGAGPAERLLFGACLGAVMAHFVIDAGLWRLRDPFPRAFLARHAPSLVPRQHPAANPGHGS